MRQRIVVCRGSSESRVFALPLISGDLCSLTIAKALWIRHLTTILLLHFRETSRRINTEIVAIFRFSVSVLSPARTTTASRLPQPLQLHLSHSKWTLTLGPFPISVASKPLSHPDSVFTSCSWCRKRGFSPLVLLGRTCAEG